MTNLKILAFAGSLRKDSINKKLTRWAVQELKKSGFDVTFIDLLDYPLPIYNQDVTSDDFPKEADELGKLAKDHNIWLISSPENNYSVTSCLKNAIDWISRSPGNKYNSEAFINKTVGIMSASPSSYGGLKSARHLRDMLSDGGCFVIPAQANISHAFSAFDDQGNLIAEANQKLVRAVLEQLTTIGNKLNPV